MTSMSLVYALTKFSKHFLEMEEISNPPVKIDLQKLRKSAAELMTRPQSDDPIGDLSLIRPSQFEYNFCIRRMVLGALKPDGIFLDPESTPYADRRMMDQGTYYHIMEANYFSFLDNKDFKVFGHWKCSNCGRIIPGFKPEEPCDGQCTTKGASFEHTSYCINKQARWLYNEYPVCNMDFRIKGTADLVLKTSDNKTIIVDHKNTNGENFIRLKEGSAMPPQSYKVQLQLYMLAINADMAVLNYINTQKPNQELQFTIMPSPYIANRLKLIIQEFNNFVDKKLIPDRIEECTSRESPRACKCPLASFCFKL